MNHKNRTYQIEPGHAHPLGATVDKKGVNFSLFSEHATSVELLLFDKNDAPESFQVIQLDPLTHNTFFFWHVYVKGLKPGTFYAYRVDGPRHLSMGYRFNPNKVLIDPYAKGIDQTLWDRALACGPKENVATAMRGIAIDTALYDWEDDNPLNRPLNESIIYEMHIGGFTRSSSADVKSPGTFRGVIEKIPYLKELGITAVELLPIYQFDSKNILRTADDKPLTNYWGYSAINFFAPHAGYCINSHEGEQVREFRDMVKALHKANIEVILDIAFHHTDESDHLGPTFSFKGIDNQTYYYLNQTDKQYYYNYSSCGNTINANHPIPAKMMVECLKYWIEEMHVDGFRFNEATLLFRGEDGAPLKYPSVLWQMELDKSFMNTKIIAEAWDAAKLYHINYFPDKRWAEWNHKYRDTIRRFVKGDPGLVGEVARRILGSADIYQGEQPINSLNFITVHDGFTLNDLVSYNEKHNEANGENNQDGINENLSWNCGIEGETDEPKIEALRERQIKNFATILMLSQGVPMIRMGDEVRHTQQGNNNAYCQDNDLTWFNWKLVEKERNLLRFWKQLIAFRQQHATIHRSRFFTGQLNESGIKDISWHGVQLDTPGWDDPNGRTLAFTLGGIDKESDIHVMINMYWEALEFEIPIIEGKKWYQVIDTYQPSPKDITSSGKEPLVEENCYLVQERSVVVLINK
jgi:isoamylase